MRTMLFNCAAWTLVWSECACDEGASAGAGHLYNSGLDVVDLYFAV